MFSLVFFPLPEMNTLKFDKNRYNFIDCNSKQYKFAILII